MNDARILQPVNPAAAELGGGLIDFLPLPVLILDERGAVVGSSAGWDAWARRSGLAPDPVGASYPALLGAGEALERGLDDLAAGRRANLELELRWPGGAVDRWLAVRVVCVPGARPARILALHEDITDRRELERRGALLDLLDRAAIVADANLRVTHWNRGAEELRGHRREEVLGRELRSVIPAEAIDALLRVGEWAGEWTAGRRDGTVIAAPLSARALHDGEGRLTGYVCLASERRPLPVGQVLRGTEEETGEGMLTLDPAGRVAYVNEAAERMLGWRSDDLEGRALTEALQHEPSPIMRAHREGATVRVEDDVFLRRDGSRLPVAYTAAPFEGEGAVEGSVVLFEDITERKAREESLRGKLAGLSWLGRVKDALREDRFLLYAQPIVELAGEQVVQRELLLRMRERSGEIIAPGDYLPLAEQYGLIGEIDRWVIARGAEVAARSFAAQINLSTRSIGDGGILEHIERCLERTRADPSRLVFEITEKALIDDEGAIRTFAERLHALGCRLALDDFGAGYGGFTYLKELPVDYLKIDMELVRGVARERSSRHVVEAIVALARGFGMRTVAEGVEDTETLEAIRAAGVDLAQGYHIARPRPLEDEVPSAPAIVV